VTSLSESSQGEVGDNREKWGDFWEKSIAINRNIVTLPCVVLDHNTVIFQKEKGRGVHIKITGMQDSNQGRQK
jgi:hypothetical protein